MFLKPTLGSPSFDGGVAVRKQDHPHISPFLLINLSKILIYRTSLIAELLGRIADRQSP